MKRWIWGLLPVAVILLLLTGCEGENRVETWREDDMMIYAFQGLEIPVPADCADLLSVKFSDPPGCYENMSDSAHIKTLFSCREKASLEAARRDNINEDHGEGWLFSVCELDQIGLEEWLVSDGYGSYLFARGNHKYYLAEFPTDLTIYRDGGEIPDESDDKTWDVWYKLNEWSENAPDMITERNEILKSYDAFALYRRDYTYGGAHAEIEYAPEDGIGGAVLVLSQPVKSGKGGVWCVERVKYIRDGWTDTRLVFPAGEGFDMTAEAYYQKLQSESATHKDLQTPMGAALAYARHAGWIPEDGGEANLNFISKS